MTDPNDIVGRLAEGPLAKLFDAPENVVGDAKVIAALRKVVAQRGERIRRDQDLIGQRGLKLANMAQWADEILKVHRPGEAGCAVCFPHEGSWPCTAADAAKAILEIHDPAYYANSVEPGSPVSPFKVGDRVRPANIDRNLTNPHEVISVQGNMIQVRNVVTDTVRTGMSGDWVTD